MTHDRRRATLEPGEAWALGALGLILVITAAWWALALWPVPGETPAWLARARAVCFNATETGLPDRSGWMLLFGQPLGMVAFLVVVWPGAVKGGIDALRRTVPGRFVLGWTVFMAIVGLTASAVRVAKAERAASVDLAAVERPPNAYPRLDREAPALGLLDQRGETVRVEDLRGRPTFVTFAFGNCETICPLVVRNVLDARDRLEGDVSPRLVVVSLDPWRDTPSSLPRLAERWELEAGDRVLSGDVERVQAVLDGWQIARKRDSRTGDITHPALVYLLGTDGRIAFAATGKVDELVALARRL